MKITSIKQKQKGGSFSEEIPLGAKAENIDFSDNKNAETVREELERDIENISLNLTWKTWTPT